MLKFLISMISHYKRARRVIRYLTDTTSFAQSLSPVNFNSTSTSAASAFRIQQIGYLTNHVVNNNNDNSESNTTMTMANDTNNNIISGTQQINCLINQVMQIKNSAAI